MQGGKIIFNIVTLTLLLYCYLTTGQELNSEQQKYLEEIVERIAGTNEKSPDLTTLFDDLNFFMKQPLNLNSASKEELNRLHLLNDFQIASLIEYRHVNGPFLSVYEILYIPGFRQADMELIQSFTYVGEHIAKDTESKLKLSDIDHMIILRYQRVLEKQSGYVPVADSILDENPDKARILGSPDKFYMRYKLNAGNSITGSFIAEKDAGEEFFRGSNDHGFDFYSANFSYKNDHTFLRKLIIGDYHVQAGQGLLFWSSYAMGKSSYIDQLPRRSTAIIPNHSADENRFLRGIALEVGKGDIRLNLFASRKPMDATLADTSIGTACIESFRESGLHSTPSEINGEKSVTQSTIGSCISYSTNRIRIGINGYYTSFNKTLLKSDKLYKAYLFHGKETGGGSVDYLYLGDRFQFFGETAIANQQISFLNGLLVFLNQHILLGVIHRSYPSSFYSYYSNAFREGSAVNNEKGFFLGGEIRFFSYTLKTYGDIFSFPWLKYTIDAPSEGNDFFIELERKYSKATVYCRYRRRQKTENLETQQPDIVIRPNIKNQIRINIQCWPFEYIRLQNRIEMVQIKNPDNEKEHGLLIFQDISLKPKKKPVEIAFRAGYFNTSAYDARIYAYENDIRFAFTHQMHYGKGWRFMTMAKWQPKSYITFWLRVAQSFYPGDNSTGSGLTEINKNHRTEIKLQSIVKI